MCNDLQSFYVTQVVQAQAHVLVERCASRETQRAGLPVEMRLASKEHNLLCCTAVLLQEPAHARVRRDLQHRRNRRLDELHAKAIFRAVQNTACIIGDQTDSQWRERVQLDPAGVLDKLRQLRVVALA